MKTSTLSLRTWKIQKLLSQTREAETCEASETMNIFLITRTQMHCVYQVHCVLGVSTIHDVRYADGTLGSNDRISQS